MTKSKEIKTWTELSKELGVAQNTLRAWRSDPTSPTGKDVAEWKQWREATRSAGPPTGGETETLAELRKALCREQGRREAATASLRELELERQKAGLIPESEAVEKMMKALIPIRRMLDGMGRACAATANPQEPMIAELAIHSHLNDYILPEVIKQIEAAAVELEAKRREAT